MSYYDNHAETFISDTLDVDMGPIYQPFLRYFKGKTILDIGCGPGRDIKYFTCLGYKVTGVEPSPVLAKFARTYSEVEIIENTIQNLQLSYQFDGIWACASLLHVPSVQLPAVFENIVQLIKPGGIIYCSFKYGEFEGNRNGRFFNFRTVESLKAVLPNSLTIIEHWITGDQRKDRKEEWLNVIMTTCSSTTLC
ncbi:class I SAM-dependent methyltransferase [Aliivibrio fischeri]|uniref:class I SAM-dependent methyltransferase n=1 Tax=Aliivibrio fischeri TaxID=668 RepID=UPI0012DAB1F6|nr:class I SAM-dependent methyltransferase [Aliivibrio fischeri]MUL16870.1 methyltransferase domain-containing protein [Aliivibrio fischeri]